MLAKLSSSGKGGRQRTVIQKTPRTPRITTDDAAKVQQISTSKDVKRSHRSLAQETLKTLRISTYTLLGEESMQVCLVEGGETWMTPYQRYLADGILLLEPTEARVVKKNSSRYTLIGGNLFRHGFTHPTLICVSGEQCTHIMAKLHEGICGSHIGGRALSSKVVRAGYYWPTMREDYTRYAQRCKLCQQHAD